MESGTPCVIHGVDPVPYYHPMTTTTKQESGHTPTPWPLTFYYIETPESVTGQPKLRTIRGRKFREGIKLEEGRSSLRFQTYIYGTGASFGLKPTPQQAWAWYEELQLSRIQRAKEDGLRAEKRLSQTREAIASLATQPA